MVIASTAAAGLFLLVRDMRVRFPAHAAVIQASVARGMPSLLHSASTATVGPADAT